MTVSRRQDGLSLSLKFRAAHLMDGTCLDALDMDFQTNFGVLAPFADIQVINAWGL